MTTYINMTTHTPTNTSANKTATAPKDRGHMSVAFNDSLDEHKTTVKKNKISKSWNNEVEISEEHVFVSSVKRVKRRTKTGKSEQRRELLRIGPKKTKRRSNNKSAPFRKLYEHNNKTLAR